MNPKSRAGRIFRNCPRFEFFEDNTKELAIDIENENAIGRYQDAEQSILITDVAIHIMSQNHTRRIEFATILEVRGPEAKDESTIHLRAKNGSEQTIRITGGDGKFKDVFSFVHFLHRVQEDLARGRPNPQDKEKAERHGWEG